MYFRNKEFWNSLNFELSNVGPGIEIDSIAVSIYPPSASARRSLLAREFVGYLGKLIGQEKVHEISVWQDKASVSKEMKRMPDTIPITEIEAIIEELRGYYPGGEIKRFHAALNFLNHKHFVILKGMSGTGKTQLALKYARAVHGFTSSKRPDSFLFVCPVRPEWTDPTGLTGYYDVLSNRYVVPPFLEAVLVAIAYRESPVFVVLDEMNLARVEYYFSDVLSCIETGHSLQLHSNSVPFEGTNGTSIRAELPVPENLFIIGTINIDETTNPVSDKVLDRASIIDMSSVDIPGFLSNLAMKNPELGESIRTCEKEITKLLNIIGDHDFSFGYRAAEEYVRYYHFAKEYLKSDSRDIIDDLMVQKVLVKLKGTERHRIILTSIRNSFNDYTKTRNMVRQLLSDLDEYGSFQATR